MQLTVEQRIEMLQKVQQLVGCPYKHRGRNKDGVDCIGVVVLGLQAAGIEVQDQDRYSATPQGDSLYQAVAQQLGDPMSDWSPETCRPGDVVLMQWYANPNHVGVISRASYGEPTLIHSYAGAGFVVEHRLAAPWTRRIKAGWRL